jgi:hypothetical protein
MTRKEKRNMDKVKYGPNAGKEFPSVKSVENFFYNGFATETLEGFASYEIESFVKWTNDPGIGVFKCTDNKERLIPSCQLEKSYYNSLPKRPKLDPFKGVGVFFGSPSHS